MTSKTEVHYNESGNGKLYYAEDGFLEKSSQELLDMFIATKRLEDENNIDSCEVLFISEKSYKLCGDSTYFHSKNV